MFASSISVSRALKVEFRMCRSQVIASVLASLAVLCASMPGRPGPRGPASFNCAEQRDRARHRDQVCCEEDGSFCLVQCDAKMCHCVDTETGHKLNTMKHMMADRDNINCTTELRCPEFSCDRICDDGYKMDRNDCPMCMCNPPPPHQHCPTIKMLEMEGCNCNCVTEPEKAGPGPMHKHEMMCPSCNDTCNQDSSENCSKECGDDETLQSVGAHGREMCVRDLAAEQPCTPEEDEDEETVGPVPGPKVKGPAKRGKVGMIQKAVTPCMSGHVCQQVGINNGRKENKCKMENNATVCVIDRNKDPSIECDPRGKFKPVQCRPITEDAGPTDSSVTTTSTPMRPGKLREMFPQMCRCVNPDDGSTVNGTERRVEMGERKPNCRNVYRNCEVPGLNPRSKMFMVPHGGEYFDKENCRTCQCVDGNMETPICSDSGNCTVLTADAADPANCTLDDGQVIPHDGTLKIGCEVCGCKNGRVRCTKRRDCKNPGSVDGGDPCDMCRRRPPSPVCGPDGRNHLSQCTAIECAMLAAVDLEDGPCQSQDVCERHPCKDDQICIRNGGVACMGKRGCHPHQLRQCVRIEDLKCPTDNSTTTVDPESQVCGDDGRTYSSLCHLIQSTTNVNVAHSGPCDDPECQGGEVCGSDGVTYPNVCVLASLAVTRVDYPGACETNGQSAEEICSTVINERRCQVTADNCMRPVFPQDGCCPICGGVVSAVIDRDALTDASETNPDIQTTDKFTLELLEAGVFQGLEDKCIVEVSLTDREDLQLTLTSTNDMYSEYCNSKSEEIVRFINNRETTETTSETPTTEETIISLPQVFDFVMAADFSPVVQLQQEEEDGETTGTMAATTGGGMRLGAGISISLILLVVVFATLYF